MLRQRFQAIILVAFLVLGGSGCIPLWVGAGMAGVVGGYVISPDTVEGSTMHAVDDVWDTAKEITGIMGHVVEENSAQGVLIAEINAARVTVTLISVNSTTTKLTIKARKAFMPKIDLAQDVYGKILNGLNR
ncbi:MAG: hypothetical protein V2A70_05800 [Candidatus Omnitrophota bacterium]